MKCWPDLRPVRHSALTRSERYPGLLADPPRTLLVVARVRHGMMLTE
jgi:hypothetical protein